MAKIISFGGYTPSVDENGKPFEIYNPPEIECDCGTIVPLWDAMTNSCDACPREYNGSGRALALDWRMAVRYGGGDWDDPTDF